MEKVWVVYKSSYYDVHAEVYGIYSDQTRAAEHYQSLSRDGVGDSCTKLMIREVPLNQALTWEMCL